jgi:hypothetical protein
MRYTKAVKLAVRNQSTSLIKEDSMKRTRFWLGLVGLGLVVSGCRSVAYESMQSSTREHTKLPYKGDPYTWGGIQEGTGGLIAATKQTMEAPTYVEPKFKRHE